jgi:hypothetical protein
MANPKYVTIIMTMQGFQINNSLVTGIYVEYTGLHSVLTSGSVYTHREDRFVALGKVKQYTALFCTNVSE